jgi:hypothetical protein
VKGKTAVGNKNGVISAGKSRVWPGVLVKAQSFFSAAALCVAVASSTLISSAGRADAQEPTIAELQAQLKENLTALNMVMSEPEIRATAQAMYYGRQVAKAAEAKNGRPFRRDAHAKATGCVRARFIVDGDIPEQYQHSIFSKPGQEFQAWVRFSNGDMLVQADKQPDARGMAVKVLGADGKAIAPELNNARQHDLLMANSQAFFNRDIFDYADDMRYLAKLQRTRWFISLMPPRLHPKQLERALQTVSATIDSPLNVDYFSILPYKLGPNIIKFSAQTCPGTVPATEINRDDFDYLTETMQNKLNDTAGCFQFMAQVPLPASDLALDDATVIWSEQEAPFVPLARIEIPPQNLVSDEQMEFCENISMNPWHGVGDWQPLGSLNKARRLVYHTVSTFRHQQNQTAEAQPDNWCLPGAKNCDPLTTIKTATEPPPPTICFDAKYQPRDARESNCHPAW